YAAKMGSVPRCDVGARRLRKGQAGGDGGGGAGDVGEDEGGGARGGGGHLPGAPAHRRPGATGDGAPSRTVPRVRHGARTEAAVRREPDPQRPPVRRGQE